MKSDTTFVSDGPARHGGEETTSARPWNRSQRYEIRFQGHLGPGRARMFAGLEMVREPGGETVLTGPVSDQTALHGILNRIRDLGVPLLSVKRLPPEEADAGSDAVPEDAAPVGGNPMAQMCSGDPGTDELQPHSRRQE
jgi:hypothetical protein